MALRRLLVSPEFLFRVERDPEGIAPGASYRLSDLELASRLSFFLWSSIPDDELLAAAERGELGDARVFEAQVERMLADPRSEALVSNFAGQWLTLRNAAAVRPDEDEFPDFGEGLRQAFRRETELLFDSVLREDRSTLGPAGGRLHLRQRAAGPALRDPERARQPLPARRARRRGARRPPRPRQHPDRDVLRQPDVAREPRQVGSREHPRDASAASAARRPGARDSRGRGAALDARGDGAASGQPGLRELPPPDGSARAVARALRRHRPLARPRGGRRGDRRLRRAAGRHAVRRALGTEGGAPPPSRPLRHHRDREADDLRARTGRRALRRARHPGHRSGRRPRRLPPVVDRQGRRPQHAVPD